MGTTESASVNIRSFMYSTSFFVKIHFPKLSTLTGGRVAYLSTLTNHDYKHKRFLNRIQPHRVATAVRNSQHTRVCLRYRTRCTLVAARGTRCILVAARGTRCTLVAAREPSAPKKRHRCALCNIGSNMHTPLAYWGQTAKREQAFQTHAGGQHIK